MTATERPQLYLVSPPTFERDVFPDRLAEVLDAAPIACLRLALAGNDIDEIGRMADAAREVAHARDVAVVIDRHLLLVERHGLDGVHLTDGSRSVRAARKELGADAIIGAYCSASRHEGMAASEGGTDYVSFGPVSGALGDGTLAPFDLFEWWSEMIEIPVVAEGGLFDAQIAELLSVTDFFAFGDEIWRSETPAAELRRLAALVNG